MKMLSRGPGIDTTQGLAGCVIESGMLIPSFMEELYEPFAGKRTAWD